MIEMLRLDERLIHGQVATQWLRTLSCDSVIVVDDNSANNKMLRNALMLAAPKNMKTVVKTCDDAIMILNDPRCKPMKVFVVTGKIEYLKRIVQECSDIECFIVGNYGCINKERIARDKYTSSMMLTEDECSELIQICNNSFPCYYWTVPATEKVELLKCLKR